MVSSKTLGAGSVDARLLARQGGDAGVGGYIGFFTVSSNERVSMNFSISTTISSTMSVTADLDIIFGNFAPVKVHDRISAPNGVLSCALGEIDATKSAVNLSANLNSAENSWICVNITC